MNGKVGKEPKRDGKKKYKCWICNLEFVSSKPSCQAKCPDCNTKTVKIIDFMGSRYI